MVSGVQVFRGLVVGGFEFQERVWGDIRACRSFVVDFCLRTRIYSRVSTAIYSFAPVVLLRRLFTVCCA